jgi:hypothetical protein
MRTPCPALLPASVTPDASARRREVCRRGGTRGDCTKPALRLLLVCLPIKRALRPHKLLVALYMKAKRQARAFRAVRAEPPRGARIGAMRCRRRAQRLLAASHVPSASTRTTQSRCGQLKVKRRRSWQLTTAYDARRSTRGRPRDLATKRWLRAAARAPRPPARLAPRVRARRRCASTSRAAARPPRASGGSRTTAAPARA